MKSLPSRERGLKSLELATGDRGHGSLPSRERGLKLSPSLGYFVGVRRSLHGSVD